MSFSLATMFSVLSIVPELPTLVNNIVVEVENSIGQIPGISSNQKLAAAEAKVNTFLKAAIQDAGALSSLSSILQPMINAAVAMFNAANVFKSKGAAPAAQ